MRLVFAFILIFSQFSLAQRTLTDKQWLEDLDFMMNRLDSVHPNLFANVSREQLKEKENTIKEKISMQSDNEIEVEFLKLVSSIQDGHTRLHGKHLTNKWFPVRIEKFSDGYFITAIQKNQSEFIGSQVLTINNHPIENVFEELKTLSPHDNTYGQEYFIPMYLTMSSILSGLHIIKSTEDKLIISLKANDKKNKMINLNPVEFNSNDDLSWFWRDYGVPANEYSNILTVDSMLPLYLKNYKQPFWYEYLKENNTVYFALNECTNEENNRFEIFNDKLWDAIDSTKADYLIIDLRNNLGGTNSIILPLLHKIIKNDSINKKGHLFIITGKKTFSAALQCATCIEFHCNPVFVGEPTGAAPNSYADPDFSVLPNSKILLMVSKYYWQNSWPWDNRKFIEPSININLSSVDYFHFKDPAMNEILKFINKINKTVIFDVIIKTNNYEKMVRNFIRKLRIKV